MKKISMALWYSLVSSAWVGILVSALFSAMSSSKEAEAQVEENAENKKRADEANKIRLAQYEREQRMREAEFAETKKQNNIAQFEKMLNSSAALKDRMTRIWG